MQGVKITGIAAVFNDGFGNTYWKYGSSGYTYIELNDPYHGRPYIMVADKPYSAKNLEAVVRFNLAPPTTNHTNVRFGIAFYVFDAQNYMVARIRMNTSSQMYAEILICRDGYETLIAQQVVAAAFPETTLSLRLIVKNGIVTLYTKVSTDTTWTQVITSSLTSVMIPLAKDRDILHIGIYGWIELYKLRINGFSFTDGNPDEATDGIAILPGYESVLANFGSAGVIRVNAAYYGYTSKVTGTVNGPYQGIYSKDWAGKGVGIDIAWFDHDKPPSAASSWVVFWSG